MIRGVDPGRVVDRIGVDAPAGECEGNASPLGHCEVGPFADDLCPDLVAVDTERIVGAVADLGMGFVCGLDVSSDTAEPQQIDGRGQQFADQLGRREMVRLDLEAALHLGADWDGFGAALENAAARRNHRAVIVGPARPRQPEQTLPLCEATLDIGVGVDKDMPVIEGGAQPQVSRHQHAVPEHVARHVADSDDGEVLALDVVAQLAEVALDRLP